MSKSDRQPTRKKTRNTGSNQNKISYLTVIFQLNNISSCHRSTCRLSSFYTTGEILKINKWIFLDDFLSAKALFLYYFILSSKQYVVVNAIIILILRSGNWNLEKFSNLPPHSATKWQSQNSNLNRTYVYLRGHKAWGTGSGYRLNEC